MNKAQFISYLENPGEMSAGDSVALAELLKNFPYFATAHLLYAKSLHNQNNIHYNNQLKTTAAYAVDRKVLHKLITKRTEKEKEKEFVISSPVSEKVKEQVLVEEVHSMLKEEASEQSIVAPMEISPEIEKPIEDIKPKELVQENIEEEMEEENIVPKPEEIIEEIPEEKPLEIIATEPELEKEYINEILSESIVYDIEASEPLIIRSEKKEAKEIPPIHKEEKKEEIIADEEELSFSSWLQQLDGGKTIFATTFEKQEKEEKTFNPFELIDKFIKEEPKMSKPKAEFFNPVNKAKQSVEEDMTFITETLAKIFLQQGNYSKALEAYQNLILKYPEKNLYFAAQIKKIKTLINQQNL